MSTGVLNPKWDWVTVRRRTYYKHSTCLMTNLENWILLIPNNIFFIFANDASPLINRLPESILCPRRDTRLLGERERERRESREKGIEGKGNRENGIEKKLLRFVSIFRNSGWTIFDITRIWGKSKQNKQVSVFEGSASSKWLEYCLSFSGFFLSLGIGIRTLGVDGLVLFGAS